MSEMLANQYFMARRFAEAKPILNKLVETHNRRLDLAKKLVICYAQTGEFQKALSLFHLIISSDIDEILSTDLVLDDCPCPELIFELEKSAIHKREEWENLTLGMLWLYCDIDTSLKYFQGAANNVQRPQELEPILTLLTNKINQLKSNGES